MSEPATVSVGSTPLTVSTTNTFVGSIPIVTGTTPFTITARDGSGNTTSRQYEIDSTEASKTFTYDENGSLISDGLRTFEWDARKQLVALNAGAHRTEFSYDGQQRRVRIVEKESGVTQSDIKVIWCQTTICEERAADGVTVIRRTFSHGEHANTIRFFVTDRLGSVDAVTDTSAVVLARYAFDPWGRRTITTGSDLTSVGYTGHRWLSDSGLSLTLYRPYDPALGRWLTEDPIGFGDGPDRYAYVHNDPVNSLDPLGLQGRHFAYGEIRSYAIKSMRDLTPPAGLADAVESVEAACARSGGRCKPDQPKENPAPADQAAWNNINNATGGEDRSGGGSFMCVGTQECWFVSKCYACQGDRKTLVKRAAPLTPSGSVVLGNNVVYFYKDDLQGWCNAEDRKSGCKCK